MDQRRKKCREEGYQEKCSEEGYVYVPQGRF